MLVRAWIILASMACALAASPGEATLLKSQPSSAVAFVRMLGSLVFVIGLFFAGAWVYRNLHRFRRQSGPPRKLQVLEAKSLGVRQAVYVVGFEQQRMLIGSGPQGLTLLTHLPDGAPQTEAERIVPVSFGEALLQALGRK